ncbi:hypothetical protein PR048_022087 [Dryococelus australis]|uniref:Integrase catalytic domain-containing protein n=1 Tax=Dryococelus australis TaxID=614101 RepID=A0ABQ9H043_9NEOP|nr:hypothetical protein PR048_022087 [Dryococelus australis]
MVLIEMANVIKELKTIFSTHGVPKILRYNMPFNSHEFQCFAREWNFSVITSSPNYPRLNGSIEIFYNEGKIDVEYALFEHRNTPAIGSPYSPAQLLFNRLTLSTFPVHDNLLTPRFVSGFSDYQSHRNDVNKRNFDRTTRENHNFYKVQQVVFLKTNDDIWHPGVVVDYYDCPRSDIVKDLERKVFKRNINHVKHSLVKYCEREDSEHQMSNSDLQKCGEQSS